MKYRATAGPGTPTGVIALLLSAALALPLYADASHTHAAHQARAYAAHGREKDAALMRKLSKVPQAFWFTGPGPRRRVAGVVRAAASSGTVPVLVAYDLPRRGCRVQGYGRWIDGFAKGIGARRAIVILEPDALAGLCGWRALRSAVKRLHRLKHARVYVDAGHSNWNPPGTMAKRLKSVHATAFSLNVSNFRRTSEVAKYGAQISRLLNGAHFVIDTSRNGRGPLGAEWCNPPKRGLGTRPTTTTHHPLIDAYLWIKIPGESDGTCHRGPPAGEWMPKYALGLARRARPAL